MFYTVPIAFGRRIALLSYVSRIPSGWGLRRGLTHGSVWLKLGKRGLLLTWVKRYTA